MAERDLELTVGARFDSASLVAEVQRITALAQQGMASVNLQGPFESGAQAARRAIQDFRAVDLSLANIQRSAKAVEGQYVAQQAALRKVEAAIRVIRELPITSQAQFNSLTQLEKLQQRLASNTRFGAQSQLGPEQFAASMAGATTAITRFEAELRRVERAQLQVAKLSKDIQTTMGSRIAVDPSFLQTLERLRETIQQTGPISKSTFNDMRRGIEAYLGGLQSATQMQLKFSEGLDMNQRAAMRVAGAYQTIEQALLSQDRAALAAQGRALRNLERIEALQRKIAALPLTPQTAELGARAGALQGPGTDATQITLLNAEYQALKRTFDSAALAAAKLAADQKLVQESGFMVARAANAIGTAYASADRQSEAAVLRMIRRQNELVTLQARAAKLPVTAESTAVLGQLGALQGPAIDPTRVAALRAEILRLEAASGLATASTKRLGTELEASGKKAAGSITVYEQLGKRIASLTQYVIAAGVAYSGFQAAAAVVRHIVELDAAMHRISATISDQTERLRVLPEAYTLIRTAMTDFGLSTADAGKLTTELTRSLNGNMQEIKSAFLPALALTVRGEVDMAEASRGLIGTVNAFGAELVGAGSKLEAYAVVSDKILKASDQSVGSIGSLTQALNNVASRAALAGVTFSETVSLLSLLQDNLGAAGRSGTGLTRVFEGLILNTEKAAKLFGVAFDPAKPVKAFEVLSQVIAKLRSELELTGGLTSSLANEFQVIIGTEQGTKQLELLIRAWPELAKRIQESSQSGGRHIKELEEHAAQLGVSFNRMANQALAAIDQILNGFDLMTGGQGGVPGQFSGLAKVFVDIGNSLEAMGKHAENTGRMLGSLVNSIRNFSLPDWFHSLLIASGATHKTNIAQAADDVGLLGQALAMLPDPPDWFKQYLSKTLATAAGAGVGFAVAGPPGALAGGAASFMAFDFTQWGLDADAAKKKLDELTKATAALQAQRGGERAQTTYKTPEEQAAEELARIEATRLRIQKERAPMVTEINDKMRSQVMLANQDLALVTRIAEAQKIAAASRRAANDAEKEFLAGKNFGTRLTSEAETKLAQLKQKAAQDEIAVNGLLSTLDKNRRADKEKMVALDEKSAAVLARVTAEYQKATASIATPFQDLTKAQAETDIETKLAAIAKEVGDAWHGALKANIKDLVTTTIIAELTAKQQEIVDALVTPYRDASEQAIIEIDKIIQKAEYLARQPSLSPEARTEVLATPALAVDKLLGVDVVERQLKSLTATFNLFGEEAARAAFAASKGFESFGTMVIQAGVSAEYAGAHGLQLLIDGFLKLRQKTQEVDFQQIRNDIAATAKAIEDTSATGGDPARILANAAAWQKYNQSLADLEISAVGAERAVASLLVVNAKQIVTQGNIENLQKQLRDLENANKGIVASFGQTGAAALATQLAFQLEGKSVDELSAKLKGLVTDIAAATQKQKELAEVAGLRAIGFSPEAAASMVAELAKFDERNKLIDQGTEALHRYQDMAESTAIRQIANLTRQNQQAEVSYQRQLELVKQTAIGANDYFAFLTASFQQSVTQGHSFFEDLDTLAKNTATNMRSSFSDIFFAVLTNNLKDAQAAFKNFFLSILRELTNLLASQAVQGFLGLFGISAKGGQLSLSGGGLASLFGGGGSPVGQAGGIGTADITRPTGSGFNSAGFAAGEAGGDPFSSVKFAQAATSVLSSAKSMSGSATVWNAVVSGWESGSGLFGGVAGAASQGFAAMETAFTGLTAVVGYAAAVVQGVLIMMDSTKSDLGKAIQTATLAVGIAAAPWTAGLSILAAGVINWIEDLFGLFDKGISSYTQKRIDAAERANRGIQTVGEGYQRASTSGDPAQVLQALRTKAEGVGTILMATPELASRLGLDVSRYGAGQVSDGRFEVSWDDVTQAQFEELLRVLAKDEGASQGIVAGRAFVSYLPQDQVGQAQNQMTEIALAMLNAFVAFRKVHDEVTQLSEDIQDVVKDFLPEDLAQNFKTSLLDPIRQQIVDAVTSGLPIADVTAKLNNLKATLNAYVNLVGLYGQLTQDFAVHSGDFVNALSYVDEQMRQTLQAADKRVAVAAKDIGLGPSLVDAVSGQLLNVDRAIEEVRRAFTSLDLSPTVAFERLAELRTAVVDRFELEKKLVLESEAGIAKLYSEHVTGILALDQAMAAMEIASHGTYNALQGIILGLQAISATSLSVSESLYTAGASLRVFIEGLPGLIAGKAGRPDAPDRGAGALPVDQILNATLAVVAPFAQTLNREIRNAFDAGDFEAAFSLLQQLGAGLRSAMDAAVAGVRQWEAAQIAVINTEADRRIKVAGQVRDMYQRQLDGQREVIEGWLDSVQAQKDAIQDQKWRIEDLARGIHASMRPLEDQIKSITRAQEQLRRTMRPIEQTIRGIGELMRPISAHLAALDRQADALQRVADDQLWNLGLQQHALEEQRDTIQDQIDLIEEMANAVLSVRDYLHDLALSQQAPPDAIGQFQLAKTTFDQLFENFTAAPDAQGLGKLQDAAQDLLNALGPLFERPSTEYRELYESIVRKLQEAADLGATFGEPASLDDLQAELEQVTGQLDDLNETSEAIRRGLDLQLHAIELLRRPLDDQLLAFQDQLDALELVKAGIQHQIDLLEDQKGPIQDQLDIMQGWLDGLDAQLESLGRQEELLSRQETTLNRDLGRIADNQDTLNQLYQDYVDSINTLREEAVDATEASADAIVRSIENGMMPLMTAVGWDAHHFYEWMRNTQYARLMELTSGQGSASWMKTAQENTAHWVNLIRIALDGFLNGDMRMITQAIVAESTDERLIRTLNNLDGSIGNLNAYLSTQGVATPQTNLGPTPDAGGLAEGAWNVAPGTYELHRGEMVAPRAQAEALRAAADGWSGLTQLAQGGGGGDTYVTIAPVIHSNQSPALIVNQVVDRIVVDIRGGGAIQDAIARMPKRSR